MEKNMSYHHSSSTTPTAKLGTLDVITMAEFLKREQASGNVLPKLLSTKPAPSLLSKLTGGKKNKEKAPPRRALLEKAAPAAATTGGASSSRASGLSSGNGGAATGGNGGGGKGPGGGYLVSQEDLDTKNELRKSVWHYLR